jgi:hypothetical protein
MVTQRNWHASLAITDDQDPHIVLQRCIAARCRTGAWRPCGAVTSAVITDFHRSAFKDILLPSAQALRLSFAREI